MSKNAKKQTASSKSGSQQKTSAAKTPASKPSDSASSTETASQTSGSGDKTVGDAGTNPTTDTQSLSPGGVGQTDTSGGNHANPGTLDGASTEGQTDFDNNDGTGNPQSNPFQSEEEYAAKAQAGEVVPQNGVLAEDQQANTEGISDEDNPNIQTGENYKETQTNRDKTDDDRAAQLGVPPHLQSGWGTLPPEGKPTGRILKPGDEFKFDGTEHGNMVVANENVYREVTPRGCKRPSYELLIKAGAEMSVHAVQSVRV